MFLINLDSINISIPGLELTPDINAIINGRITGDITIFNPVAHINLTKNNNTKSKWPEAKIGKLSIHDPVLQFSQANENGLSELNWKGNGKVFELFDLVVSNNPSRYVSAEKFQLALQDFLYTNTKGKTFNAGEGKLTIQLNKLEVHPNEAGTWDWKGIISSLDAKKFIIDSLGKNAGKLTVESAKLNNFSISSTLLLNPRELMRHNTSFRLQNVSGSYHNNINQFNWYNTAYDKNTKFFSTDSFSYQPAKDRETFIATSPFQRDYLTATTGSITIGPFDIDSYIKDTILKMGVINITNGFLADYRDKRQPRKPDIVRLLPANLIKQIPVLVLVDTVKLNNTYVEYEEVNEKTNATGKITVAELNGNITHFRNYNLSDTDSLHVKATAFLENKIFTKLDLKESYTDPSGGFLLTVRMDSADLTILNPILKPLASVELRSGQLDSMTMRVVGQDAQAYGEMKMVYRDLKVNAITDGKKRGLLSFFINGLIKNKNNEKTGIVFFERLRDRSAINYLVKMTLSGVSSSIGIKKSNKRYRKYKKDVNNTPLAGSFK